MTLCYYCGMPTESPLQIFLAISDEEGDNVFCCSECVPRCDVCSRPLDQEGAMCRGCGGNANPETDNYWGW